MMASDIETILAQLHEAGGIAVDASVLPWTSRDLGSIERALTMRYMRRDSAQGQVTYSLTRAGYDRIEEDIPFGRILRYRLRMFLR